MEIYSQAVEKYNDADAKYKEVCKKAKALRKDFLQERAGDVALNKGTIASQEIKSVIQKSKSMRSIGMN